MDKNDFERSFWGNCCNTYGEETKQFVYAKRMGLELTGNWRSSFNIDMQDTSVVDVGGGPVSLLLKCINVRGTVVDPLKYPTWVTHRYEAASINHWQIRGEDLYQGMQYDEVWIYNVLQHVDDPALIIKNAHMIGGMIRLFEWIDFPPHPGHPHMLTEEFLLNALGSEGQTEYLNEYGCIGRCFYGEFPCLRKTS
jgi:hypothetical protein